MNKVVKLEYSNPEFQVEVEWDITQRCNYSCSYCASYNNTQPFYFKSLNEYISSFTYLKSFFGNKKIRLTFLGGEPTLFKDWPELINWLSENQFIPHLTTNLSIPVEKYIHRLKTTQPFVSASFHPEYADKVEFIRNIIALKNKNLLLDVNVLGLKEKWDYCVEVFNDLNKITNTGMTRIKNEFTGTLSIADEFLEYSEQQEKYFQTKDQFDKHLSIILESGKKINPSINAIRSSSMKNFKGMLCEIGQNRITIKPNGDVYPSACMLNYPKAVMGNIYKKNIRKANKSIICPFNICACGPDLRIPKEKQ